MPLRIEDYALIGDTQTAALVGIDGSIDWMCVPRFDSPACFAALLGDESNGRWLLAPAGDVRLVERRYRDDTLVLETEFHTDGGVLQIVDSMPPGRGAGRRPHRRCLEGRSRSAWSSCCASTTATSCPGCDAIDGGLRPSRGPTRCTLTRAGPTRGRDLTTVAEFELDAGDEVPFVLTWFPSHEPAPLPRRLSATEDDDGLVARVVRPLRLGGRGPIARSCSALITLKALTYAPTGGIVAAPTTSLPEAIGGVRNWDYRYCWLRDATLTL